MSWKYTTSKNRDSSQLKVVNICVFSNVLTSSRVDEPYFKRPKIAVKVKCEDDGEDGDEWRRSSSESLTVTSSHFTHF
jgi:hypothetical protein